MLALAANESVPNVTRFTRDIACESPHPLLLYSVMPRLRMQEARRCFRIRAWPRSYASNKHMQFKSDALASNKHIGIWGYRRSVHKVAKHHFCPAFISKKEH